MANPRTLARLEARILQRAAYCLEFEVSDPRATFITLTKVKLARDLSTAVVSYSVLGSEADRRRTQHMLEDASGFIQRQVARVLKTRRVPRLSWMFDDSVEYAAEIDRKIRDALLGDREVNPEAHADMNVDEDDSEEADELAEVEYESFLSAQDEEEDERR